MRTALTAAAVFAFTCGVAGTALAQKKTTSGCGSDATLKIELLDTAGDKLVSDGGGAYVNASARGENVTAVFQVNNCTQDMILNLNSSKRFMRALLSSRTHSSKFLNFDRVASVPRTDDPAFPASTFCASAVVRNADGSIAKVDGQLLDNYAGCAQDGTGAWYVRRAASISLYEGPASDHRLAFQKSAIGTQGGVSGYDCATTPDPLCGTDYVRVYHRTPDTWEIVSDTQYQATAAFMTYLSGTYQVERYEAAPLHMVVTKLP